MPSASLTIELDLSIDYTVTAKPQPATQTDPATGWEFNIKELWYFNEAARCSFAIVDPELFRQLCTRFADELHEAMVDAEESGG